MAKILGLDLGTNSIGWAVVDDEKKVIEKAGVRIFPEGVVAKTIGTGEKEQSLNATRREKRQTRRQFYRKRLRKIKLLEVLIKQEMCPLTLEELKTWKNWDKTQKKEGQVFPSSAEFKNWIRLNPYELRSKSLQEELTPHELGRVFYHLIQRRGFLSNRKGGDKESKTIFEKGKPEENILPINETKEKAKNSTLGNYFLSILPKEGVPYQTIRDEKGIEVRVRGRYTTRTMYIAEFQQIWQVQSQYSDLESRMIENKKIREFKGTLTSKRNRKRIENLQEKYGCENVLIGSTSPQGITKVTTVILMPFKQFLAGEIETVELENGEQELRFKSSESLLFWQRPLRSQKGLLANCRFENHLPVIDCFGNFRKNKEGKIQTRSKKPCPLSHPEFELFRAYQFINNIKYGKNPSLTTEERQKVLAIINKDDKNFDFVKIPKELKLTYEKFNFENNQKVAGNYTIKHLSALFPKDIWEASQEEIWHCFYFYEDNDKLLEKLKKDYHYTKDIEALKKIKLKDGYSNVSLKAIRNITPFLKMGYQFDRAVILGGVKNAFGKRWEYFKDCHATIVKDVTDILKGENKDGEAIDKIKNYLSLPIHSYGFQENDPTFSYLYHHSQEIEQANGEASQLPTVENLRNPIVQQGLHEVRRVVNSLMKEYQKEYGEDFHFDKIKVEMGRDLRNSKKERQEISNKIRENEGKNNEARTRLAEYGLQASRSNMQKYLMWKEIEDKAGRVQCPYTGKAVAINDLLGSDNAIQIEHIIPYSTSLDDSFGNKTLCESNFNREKGELTPYLFYQKNSSPKLWGVSSWEAVEERAFRLLPYRKAKRFIAKREFEKSSFIERQLNDSRYIAKKSAELLSHICKDVRVMPGQLTAELRHLWGLNNILQPIQNLDSHLLKNAEEKSQSVYIVKDDKGQAVSAHKIQNERPTTLENEILLPYSSTKKKAKSKYFEMEIKTPELENGQYWAKFKVGSTLKLIPKYIQKSETSETEIVFRGQIDKGTFKNDTTGNISKTNCEDGVYWAKFTINEHKLISTEEQKEHPKTKSKKQLALFGNVYDGEFKCYIYSCKTELPNGKYWLILDIDYAQVEFIKAINPIPKKADDEICILSSIDDNGNMVTDVDNGYKRKTDKAAGKYYAILNIESQQPELYPIENPIPKLEKGQEIIEGKIWVDKYTGEIKFDPKKNREDHRHHAIDAITIALTEQSYLQRLSTYNAARKSKQREKGDSTEKFPEPWSGFNSDVKKAANSILISYKKNNKTLTKSKKGFSVRGQLHKENVFGKRKAPEQEQAYHRRTKITELKNNKHIEKVVDAAIRKIILKHLNENFGIDINNAKGFDVPDKAFYKDGEWQLFLPNKKGESVPIKKVRIKETIGNAMPLKPSTNINQWVNPRNNHHVMIYKDHYDCMQETIVSFWEVIERVKAGDNIYQLPADGKEKIATLEINDVYLLGLSDEEYRDNKDNNQFLSQHLYRVQKLSSKFYTFRFHLASTLNNKKEEAYIQSFGAWQTANPIKVEIDILGKITKR